jgi:hypothetical protein
MRIIGLVNSARQIQWAKMRFFREETVMRFQSIACAVIVAIALPVSNGFAQCGCATASYAPTSTYYAPASYVAEYAPATTTAYYAPTTYVATYAPTTTYYAPTAYVASYAPATTAYDAPATTAYYAPATYVANYATTTAYYAPAAYTVGYAPTTTYYAPAATTAYYAPAVPASVIVNGRAGTSIYGTAKIYVPGEPVRNTIRAITP